MAAESWTLQTRSAASAGWTWLLQQVLSAINLLAKHRLHRRKL
jgi:hypothetical protein